MIELSMQILLIGNKFASWIQYLSIVVCPFSSPHIFWFRFNSEWIRISVCKNTDHLAEYSQPQNSKFSDFRRTRISERYVPFILTPAVPRISFWIDLFLKSRYEKQYIWWQKLKKKYMNKQNMLGLNGGEQKLWGKLLPKKSNRLNLMLL